MIKRGKIFLGGFVLFIAGFAIPFFIRLVMGAFGATLDSSYDFLYYLYFVGTVLALLIGVPMILVGIFMRPRADRR